MAKAKTQATSKPKASKAKLAPEQALPHPDSIPVQRCELDALREGLAHVSAEMRRVLNEHRTWATTGRDAASRPTVPDPFAHGWRNSVAEHVAAKFVGTGKRKYTAGEHEAVREFAVTLLEKGASPPEALGDAFLKAVPGADKLSAFGRRFMHEDVAEAAAKAYVANPVYKSWCFENPEGHEPVDAIEWVLFALLERGLVSPELLSRAFIETKRAA